MLHPLLDSKVTLHSLAQQVCHSTAHYLYMAPSRSLANMEAWLGGFHAKHALQVALQQSMASQDRHGLSLTKVRLPCLLPSHLQQHHSNSNFISHPNIYSMVLSWRSKAVQGNPINSTPTHTPCTLWGYSKSGRHVDDRAHLSRCVGSAHSHVHNNELTEQGESAPGPGIWTCWTPACTVSLHIEAGVVQI